MTEKFTPGPWKRAGFTVCADRKTPGRRGMIASCASAPMYKDQWGANANVMAAAPDLYTAAADALDHLTDALLYPDDDPLVQDLRAALAKARGEEGT